MFNQNRENLILRLLREGNIEALDYLYLQYSPKVRHFAFGFLKNQEDAEDITHDVFLKIWNERKYVSEAVSFDSYLYRMTRNEIFNFLKHKEVESNILSSLGVLEQESDDYNERLHNKELLQQIDLHLKSMPLQRQRVFYMSREENLSYQQIADKLHISPRTVQYHISQTLSQLRKLLS